MEKGTLGTDTVVQVGIIVKDIEKTAKRYADFLGVGMPDIQVTDEWEKARTTYNGRPSKARAKLAFFKVGTSMSLELIQPDGEPSTWREHLDRKGEGVHHVAFIVRGMKEKVAACGKEGFPLVQSGEYTGGRYAYLDSARDLKVILELLEND
jgi:methylmalonyl-CoA/ethylmalonyl-CoA epimerase